MYTSGVLIFYFALLREFTETESINKLLKLKFTCCVLPSLFPLIDSLNRFPYTFLLHT
jgi:hypothetical protein